MTNELQPWLRTHDAWRKEEPTLNPRWLLRFQYEDGGWSEWQSYEDFNEVLEDTQGFMEGGCLSVEIRDGVAQGRDERR